VTAGELMSTPAVSIPEHSSLAHAAEAYFRPYRYNTFPVTDEQGHAIGLVSITQVEAGMRGRRPPAEISAVADCDPALIVHPQEDVAGLLERPAFVRFGRAVVIDAAGRPLGLVSITDVQRSLRAYKLAGSNDRGHAHAAAG
jgi:predicted transcriptional regulator